MFPKFADLTTKRALITGATGHLGRVFCDTFAALGADLILVDRPRSELVQLCSELNGRYSIDVTTIECDLEQQGERESLIKAVGSQCKQLNILVNNAAFVGDSDLEGWAEPLEGQSIESWRRALEVNLTAAFHLCQGLAPLLRLSSEPSIINISSIYSTHAPDWSLYEDTSMANPAAYGASKAGLVQLTKWLASALAPEIRVNALSPGGIYRGQPEVFVKRYAQKTPLKRMAQEDDFRGPIAFLASSMSAYITGHVLEVDGGWCCM